MLITDHLKETRHDPTEHARHMPRTTEPVVQQYYQDNRDAFEGTMVRASHIVLRLPPNAPEAEAAAARAKLTDLRAQIVAGKLDFAEAAKKTDLSSFRG